MVPPGRWSDPEEQRGQGHVPEETKSPDNKTTEDEEEEEEGAVGVVEDSRRSIEDREARIFR